MANTFTLTFKSVNTRSAAPGDWYKRLATSPYTYTNPTSNADILSVLNQPAIVNFLQIFEIAPPASGTVTGGVGTLSLDVDDTQIVLTGQAAGTFSFAGLPDGFIITAATLKLTLDPISLDDNIVLYNALRNGFSISNIGAPHTTSVFNIPLVSPLLPIDVIFDSYGISVDTSPLAGLSPRTTAMFSAMSISGTYEIFNNQYSLDNSIQPVQAGTQVTVTSDPTDPNHLKLNQLSAIDVVYNNGATTIPVASILTQTEFLLIFLIPSLGVDTPQSLEIDVTGNGTQFSGSVTLSKLETIYFKNAPGIYKLDTSATADTLYDIENGGTIQVAIPNPFFKTGFLGG